MKAITLRNIPPDLQKRLEEEAACHQASLNKTVLRLLHKATGLGPEEGKRTRFHDLDHLAGTWSEEDAAAFDKAVEELRTLDPEIWE